LEYLLDDISVDSSSKVTIETDNSKLDILLNNINKVVGYFAQHPINLYDGSSSILSYPKYLTSQNLFDLQLNDSSFRKTILNQYQIVLKSFLKPISMIQKRLFAFKDQEKAKINETLNKIRSLFNEPYNNKLNKLFSEEESWENWKEAGCPSYEKHPSEALTTKLAKKSEKRKPNFKVDVINNYDFNKAFEVNHNDLQNIGVTLKFTESINNDNPFLGNYVERVLKDIDPAMEIEESSKIMNADPVKFV
jgi:THO complex subunit 1